MTTEVDIGMIWPNSFLNICQSVDIDPLKTRHGIITISTVCGGIKSIMFANGFKDV